MQSLPYGVRGAFRDGRKSGVLPCTPRRCTRKGDGAGSAGGKKTLRYSPLFLFSLPTLVIGGAPHAT